MLKRNIFPLLLTISFLFLVAVQFLPEKAQGDAGIPKYQRTYPHGHAGPNDGGNLSLISYSVAGSAATVTIDLGTLKNGDTFIANSYFNIAYTVAPTFVTLNIGKSSGTATLSCAGGAAGLSTIVASFGGGSPYQGTQSGICTVTGDGTLIARSNIFVSGGTISSYQNDFILVFLHKS